MDERIFFEQLLTIPELKVDNVFYESNRIILHCYSKQSVQTCPQCGLVKDKPVKRYEERQIRDLNISGKEAWSYLRVRQFECECGHYFHEPFNWVAKGKSYTLRQAKFIFELCARQPFSEVGAIVNMNAKTVERLCYAQAEQIADLPERYGQLRKLGIDELSLYKGKGNYCCVLTDLERGIQLDVLPNRRNETLVAHFQGLGSEFCQQIKHVSCDMWEPYTEVAECCFPQAKITIDRFHVVKALNNVLDVIRKTLRREHPKENSFKKLKWVLFKRAEFLSQKQCESLKQAFQKAPELHAAYELRNRFHAIFDQAQGKPQAREWLERWLRDVRFTADPAWTKFLKTLSNRAADRWKELILNFVESGISNAVAEGLNNLIRYMRRLSFGVSNFEHMRLRILVSSA
ncbi:MAG: ISL3 family transposase [Bacteroidota bacterium]